MHRPQVTTPALLLLAAVSILVLATMATRESGAYWRQQETAEGAKVSAGVLELTADGAQSVQLGTRFAAVAMRPNEVRQKSIVIRNGGQPPLTFTLGTAAVIPTSGSVAGGVVASARLMSTGSAAASCDDAQVNPSGSSALPVGGTPVTLLPSATARVCLRVTVAGSPTSGSSYTAEFTFRAQQKAP